ncbi:hypothetical protein MNV49_007902 [Pseudohyphozyma bogoriensis]|nr:hypothetical protein MNV49_007902 [Pseudohyphozyma bogoriensis]
MAPKRKSDDKDKSSKASTKDKKPKKSEPMGGMTEEEFLENGPTLTLTLAGVGDEDFTTQIKPKIFSTGTLGWGANPSIKVAVDHDGTELLLPCSLSFSLSVHKSKKSKAALAAAQKEEPTVDVDDEDEDDEEPPESEEEKPKKKATKTDGGKKASGSKKKSK